MTAGRAAIAVAALAALVACEGGSSEPTASDVVADLEETVPLRAVRDGDLLSTFAEGELEEATGADHVEARVVVGDASGTSFVIVADRDGGFDSDDLGGLTDLTEELAASPELPPFPGTADAFGSECCIVRLVDGVAVLVATGHIDGIIDAVAELR